MRLILKKKKLILIEENPNNYDEGPFDPSIGFQFANIYIKIIVYGYFQSQSLPEYAYNSIK